MSKRLSYICKITIRILIITIKKELISQNRDLIFFKSVLNLFSTAKVVAQL